MNTDDTIDDENRWKLINPLMKTEDADEPIDENWCNT